MEVIDADQVARYVSAPGMPACDKIIKEFGERVLGRVRPGREILIDRKILSEIVFNEPGAREKLERIMVPIVGDEIERRLIILYGGEKIVVLESAILIEQGFANDCRPLVVVSVSREVQVQRLMKRNGFTEAQAHARINAQMSNERKVNYADIVIDNDSDETELLRQADITYDNLKLMIERGKGS